ncbi:MAG: cytochrome c oxidase assembly protein [Deltaproteobacteria bacterium]|nr:cytochrome c oxidase assembly protein [Deltaproteobacteria bacterium]
MIEGWSVHPSIPLGLGLIALLYGIGVGPLRRRLDPAARIEPLQIVTFAAGLLVFFLALTGPIHDLSDSYLFSAHMVQHLIITLVAPPLLLAATPEWLARGLLRPPAVYGMVRFLTRAPVAYLIYNFVLALWHLPRLYNSTLVLLEVHILEHVLFIGTAFLMWMPVLSPLPELRLRPIVQVLYLILLTFPMKGIGALLTMSDSILYPAYALAPRAFGLDAFSDQRIGGLLMWLPAGLILWGGAAIVFLSWWAREHRSDEIARNRAGATPAEPV